MPLDAEEETFAGHFHRFDALIILRASGNDPAGRRRPYCLMVEGIGPDARAAHDLRDAAARHEIHVVGRDVPLVHAETVFRVAFGLQILDVLAPADRVQKLHAAADAEDRQVRLIQHEIRQHGLRLIAAEIDGADTADDALAEERRVDVRPAGKDHPVQAADGFLHEFRILKGRQDHGNAARALHGVRVGFAEEMELLRQQGEIGRLFQTLDGATDADKRFHGEFLL